MIDRDAVSELERGEDELAVLVRRWRERLDDLRAVEQHAVLASSLEAKMWEARGFDRTSSEARLEGIDEELLSEPHALGWLHQHFGEEDRSESFAAHTGAEEKHADQIVSTQLYTPRWVADLLAELAIAETSGLPSVTDPACGGGQMLLAAFDALTRRGTSVDDAVRSLHGADLDPRAVDICRATLKLETARRLGRRDDTLEDVIDANVVVADTLVETPFERAGVVLTNPPYMGSRSMPAHLKERLRSDFRPFHGDLYVAFIRRCHDLGDIVGVLAQQTIWYLSRFEKARRELLELGDLTTFLHLGPHVFQSLTGEKANVVAFVQRSDGRTSRGTVFVDARHLSAPADKRVHAIDALMEGGHEIDISEFETIPGAPLAHWLDTPLRRHFADGRPLGDLADIPGGQNKTGRNREFVRPWSEVPAEQIRYAPGLWDDGAQEGRWVFYSKGGRFSPWWGNWQNVVDWSDAAREFYDTNRTSNLLDESYWFRRGICYTDFGGSRFNARLMPAGCLFDMAGPAIFPEPVDGADEEDVIFAMLALLNSTASRELLNALNPSIHYQVRDLRNLPVPRWDLDIVEQLAPLGRRLVEEMRFLHEFVEGPTRREHDREELQRAKKIAGEFMEAEHEADRTICELFGVPELAVPVDKRPVHRVLRVLCSDIDFVGRQ